MNPFVLKAARKKLSDQNVEIGSRVHLTWEYSRAFGPGEGQFQGEVLELDDRFITVQSDSKVNLRLGLTALTSVRNLSDGVLSDEDAKITA